MIAKVELSALSVMIELSQKMERCAKLIGFRGFRFPHDLNIANLAE